MVEAFSRIGSVGGFTRNVGVDLSLATRVDNLEGNIYEYEIYTLLEEGTEGTITLPEGASIRIDQYPNADDCLLAKADAHGRPIDAPPVTSVGTEITATLTAEGEWTLSGEPVSYPVCLIYQIWIYGKDARNIDKDRIIHGHVISGLRSPTAPNQYEIVAITGLSSALEGKVSSILAGDNVTVDNTDPQNPIINVEGSSTELKAENISYENNFDLDAENVQEAIDNLATDFQGHIQAEANAHPDTVIALSETYTGNLKDKTTQAEANAILDAFSGGGGLPEGNKYEALTIGSSDSKPLFKGGAFSLRSDGVLWQEIDVASMSRQTPSSYSASSESLPASPVANAFNDDVNTRWVSDIDINDAYIDIDFASAVSLSVLGIYLTTNFRPKFITVTDKVTDEILLYYETLRNNYVFDNNLNMIQYLTLDKIVSTTQIRIRFQTDWFIGNRVSCSVLQFYSGALTYKPIGLFTNAGQFSLLSQTETTYAQSAVNFRPIAWAGFSKNIVQTGNKTISTDDDFDTSYRVASGNADFFMPNPENFAGKNIHIHNTSTGTVRVRMTDTSGRMMINGERIVNLIYTIPRYNSALVKCVNTASVNGYVIIPDVPEHILPISTRKSTNARQLDDYEESTFTPTITCGNGSVTATSTGTSVKVGQNVNFSINAQLSAVSSPNGTLTIGALPYTSFNSDANISPCNIIVENSSDIGSYRWVAEVNKNATTINVRLVDSTGVTVGNPASYLIATSVIKLSGIYRSST